MGSAASQLYTEGAAVPREPQDTELGSCNSANCTSIRGKEISSLKKKLSITDQAAFKMEGL